MRSAGGPRCGPCAESTDHLSIEASSHRPPCTATDETWPSIRLLAQESGNLRRIERRRGDVRRMSAARHGGLIELLVIDRFGRAHADIVGAGTLDDRLQHLELRRPAR